MGQESLNLELSSDEWCLHRNRYDREEDGFYESLFALTNGRVGVRATVDFASGGGHPGVFLSDLYGPAVVVPSELVNALHFGYWTLAVGGTPLDPANSEIIDFQQSLDLYRAAVSTRFTLRDLKGRVTKIGLYTFLPASESDVMLTIFNTEAVDHSAKIEIHSGIDWSFGNGYLGGTETGQRLHHLEVKETRSGQENLTVCALNRGTQKYVAGAVGHISDDSERLTLKSNQRLIEILSFLPEKNKTNSFVRIATFGTGNDPAELMARCERRTAEVKRSGVFSLLSAHRGIWESRWKEAAVSIDAPASDVQAFNFGIFQLLQSPDREASAANIPARGLTSEYHSGHFFFNTELYLVPYYAATEPAVARAMIMYRAQTLKAAQEYAEATLYEGARYPEESDLEGRAASPRSIYDPFTGQTSDEWSGIEVMHLSADVLYALERYLTISGDDKFILVPGVLEMIVEIARYSAGLMKYDPEIKGRGARSVMCFDEFHYHVNHHFATNYLSCWALRWAAAKLENIIQDHPAQDSASLEAALEKSGGGAKARDQWLKIADEVFLPPPDKDGVFPQYEGYFSLPEQTVEQNKNHRLPEIGDGVKQRMGALLPFETRLIKQADIVLLMSMFPESFEREAMAANFKFYDLRTLHASSLSTAPHAGVAARLGEMETAYHYLLATMRYNLDFQPRANYLNGIHLAAYAGAWNALVEGFLGFRSMPQSISFNPRLPREWKTLNLRLTWHGNRLDITASHNELIIKKLSGPDANIAVRAGLMEKTISAENLVVTFIF
jgi:kojibiose phosphorylase